VGRRSNLTNGQLVIWMGQHFAAGVPCYENALTFVICGPVDPERLDRAFQAVIDGSDTLRSVINDADGVPMRNVLPDLRYELPVVDLGVERDPDEAMRAWVAARIAVPRRLDERLFDAALLRLGSERWALYLDTHHLLHDGRSCQIVYERTADCYEREGRGELGDASEGPSFAEYAAVEQAARGSAAWRDADAHWRSVLERIDEPLEFYGVPSSSRTHEERWVRVDLGPDRTAALRERARSPGFRSLNVDLSLLAIFAGLVLGFLHRAGGACTPSIGLPFHNRERGTRDTIGMFQQVYPVAVELDADETFVTLTAKAMRGIFDVLSHAPQGSGNLTQRAANDVLLNYLPMAFPPFAGLPTHADFVPRAASDGSHCLMVQVHDLDAVGSFSVDLVFNTGVFDHQRRRAATAHLLSLVDQFIADPTVAVDAVDILEPDERGRLAQLATGPSRSCAFATADAVVAATAASTPDAVAVESGHAALTYAELDQRANRLAHHLRAVGAGPGSIVAVYDQRSLDLVVAVLAVFRSGAGYLPLDVTYPVERLEFILDDARAEVLVTSTTMPLLRGGTDRTVVHLDDLNGALASYPSDRPITGVSPDDLAYVIYTSGSTGRPKGAAVPHRALVNVVEWQAREASLLSRPRALQFSPLSFDVSLQELFATWCTGGTVIVPEADVRRDPEALLRLLVHARVQQLYAILTPLQQLAETVDRLGVVPESLREVFTCGERVTMSPSLARFFERLPDCRFQNQYGSSEDFIATAHTVVGPPGGWPSMPPIGRPLPNTRVHLLTPRLQPVPMGVPGEICVGGAQASLGYLHRPELTAERFVPDPFGDEPGAVLFRSGDLARLLPGGELQFLGRMDGQVKLRGFRIETGEIEAVLREHPLVADAAVVLREDDPGAKRLVAYLVPAPGWTVEALPDVHRVLRDTLAPPMVPASFVTLDQLPTTPSGKLDRRALPRPDTDRPELEVTYAAPEGALEVGLADTWRRMLGIERIGRDDDFFDLGGDSLLAVEAVVAIEDLVDRPLALVTLFEAPTIAKLADLLHGPARTPRSLVPLRVTGPKTPFFFASAQAANRLVAHLDVERPFYSLHPKGMVGLELDCSVEEMAAAYLDDVREVQPHGPYLLGGACLGGQVAFEMARRLVADGEEVARTVLVESYAPGIVGFRPATVRGRLARRATRVLASLETSRPGALVVSLLTRARYDDRYRALRKIHRSNIRALLAYSPAAYPGPVTVLVGDRDDGGDDLPDLGWHRYARGGVDVHHIAGYHGAVLREPHVHVLASELAACLDGSGI